MRGAADSDAHDTKKRIRSAIVLIKSTGLTVISQHHIQVAIAVHVAYSGRGGGIDITADVDATTSLRALSAASWMRRGPSSKLRPFDSFASGFASDDVVLGTTDVYHGRGG